MKLYPIKISVLEKVIYAIFIFFSLIYIITLQYRPYPFSYLIKIIPILSLSLIPLLNISGNKGKLIFSGLLFSAIGDIFLAAEGHKNFIYGLSAFGFAHIMYITAFIKNPVLKQKRSVLAFFFIIYAAVIEYFLLPVLGNMLIPATIYLLLLMFAGISSAIGKRNNLIIITGFMLFMVSDSIIAINTFLTSISHSSFWIMLSYFPAQFLIVYGSTRPEIG